jgi:hypothetical protein
MGNGIQGDAFHPLGSILPLLQWVRLANSQARDGRTVRKDRSMAQDLGNNPHRDANGVDTQRLQAQNIGLGKPALPVFIKDLVGCLRVRLGESAV